MTSLVLGSQWGDEGKGKLVDILCREMEFCARCQGGNNAGHTIVNEGVKYEFHILPSGLINSTCTNIVGAGAVIHIPSFFEELETLQKQGLDTEGRIFISDRAHVVTDLHQKVDNLEEMELGKECLGTTGKGIGPTYSSKASRIGIRVSEVFEVAKFEQKLRALAAAFKKRYGDLLVYNVEDEIERFKVSLLQNSLPVLSPFSDGFPTQDCRSKLAKSGIVKDIVPILLQAEMAGKKILVEGANATMLDIDYGTYPFVTSSYTGTGGAISGLALNPFRLTDIVGVVKAYTTRVGTGPFPTEQLNVRIATKQARISLAYRKAGSWEKIAGSWQGARCHDRPRPPMWLA
jgi:adenylosuccinate synthase